jgi:hypothetical protein
MGKRVSIIFAWFLNNKNYLLNKSYVLQFGALAYSAFVMPIVDNQSWGA